MKRSGRRDYFGAMPCMGLLTVEELMEPLKGMSIREWPPRGNDGLDL